MPTPEFAKSWNFTVDKIVFNNGNFAVAWGWDVDDQKHLAMRWNGDDDNVGSYPVTSNKKYPLWFFLPQELTLPIARGLLGNHYSDGFALAEVIQAVIAQAPAHERNL